MAFYSLLCLPFFSFWAAFLNLFILLQSPSKTITVLGCYNVCKWLNMGIIACKDAVFFEIEDTEKIACALGYCWRLLIARNSLMDIKWRNSHWQENVSKITVDSQTSYSQQNGIPLPLFGNKAVTSLWWLKSIQITNCISTHIIVFHYS